MSRTVLKPGTRVYHRVFEWLRGEVVEGHGGGLYRVLVDPDVEHFSKYIWISSDEIVVEKPRRETKGAGGLPRPSSVAKPGRNQPASRSRSSHEEAGA